MILYMMNTISPISLYIKLDKLPSLKKTYINTCSSNPKPYSSNIYIQAVELCNNFLFTMTYITTF